MRVRRNWPSDPELGEPVWHGGELLPMRPTPSNVFDRLAWWFGPQGSRPPFWDRPIGGNTTFLERACPCGCGTFTTTNPIQQYRTTACRCRMQRARDPEKARESVRRWRARQKGVAA